MLANTSILNNSSVVLGEGETKGNNDTSMLNASMVSSSSSSNILNHTSTTKKILKEMAQTLPVKIPEKSSTTTNK